MLVACLAVGLSLGLPRAPRAGHCDAEQQARAAVAQAEAAVQAAAERRALWTTAQDALRSAQEALARRDYAAAQQFARFAAEQARLGIQQLDYPRLE